MTDYYFDTWAIIWHELVCWFMVISPFLPVLVCCNHKIVLHWYENKNNFALKCCKFLASLRKYRNNVMSNDGSSIKIIEEINLYLIEICKQKKWKYIFSVKKICFSLKMRSALVDVGKRKSLLAVGNKTELTWECNSQTILGAKEWMSPFQQSYFLFYPRTTDAQ